MPYSKKGLGKDVAAEKDSINQCTIAQYLLKCPFIPYEIDKEYDASNGAATLKNKTPPIQRGFITYFFIIFKCFRYSILTL
jgi:hypothetical protein